MASRTEVELMTKCQTESAPSQHAKAFPQDQEGSNSKHQKNSSSWMQHTSAQAKERTKGSAVRVEDSRQLQTGTSSPLPASQTRSIASISATAEGAGTCDLGSLVARSSETTPSLSNSQATYLRDGRFPVSTKSGEIWRFPGSRVWVAQESKFPVPPHVQSRWPELKNRLLVDLREVEDEMIAEQANEKSRLKRSPNRRRIHPELRMSGRQDALFADFVTISPCIWILCGSQSCRKKVRRITKTLCLPVNLFEQPIEVHNGAPEPHANRGFIPLSRLNTDQNKTSGLNYLGGVIIHHVEAISPTLDHQSACGLLCCTTFLKDGVIMTQHISRIGGLLKNNSKDYNHNQYPIALTTSHGIFEDIWTNGVEFEDLKDGGNSSAHDDRMDREEATSSDMDSDMDSNAESLIESETDAPPLCSSGQRVLGEKSPVRVAEWIQVSSQEVIGLKCAGQVLPEPISARVRRPQMSRPGDYALLRSQDLAGLKNISSQSPEVEITSYLPNSELTEGSLTAVFGVDDLSKTTLLPGSMMLPLGQEELPVRKVELVAPLAAAYPSQPLALLMTAQDLRQTTVESFPEVRPNFLRERKAVLQNADPSAASGAVLHTSVLEQLDGPSQSGEIESTSSQSMLDELSLNKTVFDGSMQTEDLPISASPRISNNELQSQNIARIVSVVTSRESSQDLSPGIHGEGNPSGYIGHAAHAWPTIRSWQNRSNATDKPSKKYIRTWTCCMCGDSGMSDKLTGCPSCGYRRCANCPVQMVKIR
ncbi:hypothetical protein CSIM01_05438 [Colletotrichum simmondsii]|uniref:Uncharacterized protein n=1 Tax=Colletotrichum simmondsii TaxID=703756 RepID=A0A135TQA5_9PEZI|nr:hypothetical protein CSIM01_05438 [Colletotrichum simmondsii]